MSWLNWQKDGANLIEQDDRDSPLISIVIPLNRLDEGRLDACLASIGRQKYRNSEIIIVDSSFDPRVKRIATVHRADTIVTKASKPQARNIGVASSQGELILHLDQDMILSVGVLSECVSRFKEGFQAVVIPEEADGRGFFKECRKIEKKSYQGDSAIEAARLVTRNLHDKLGGFEESFGNIDEYPYHAKIERAGFKIGRIKQTIISCEPVISLRKKLDHGRYSRIYKAKYSEKARRQFSPLKRLQLYSDVAKHDPIHFLGIFLLKSLDFAAFSFGSLLRPPLQDAGLNTVNSKKVRDNQFETRNEGELEETMGTRYIDETEKRTIQRMMKLAIQSENLAKDRVALDIGGGPGRLSRILIDSGFFTIEIDISQRRCKQAQLRHSNSSFQAICADMRFLPIRTRNVSFVLSFRSAKYVLELGQVLTEVERTLVEKGVLIMELPNALFLPYLLGKGAVKAVPNVYRGPTFEYLANVRLFTPKQAATFIINSGMTILAMEKILMLPQALLSRIRNQRILSFLVVLEKTVLSKSYSSLVSRSLVFVSRKRGDANNTFVIDTPHEHPLINRMLLHGPEEA